MKLVNLTPHEVIIDPPGIIIPPSGKVVRLKEADIVSYRLDGITFIHRDYSLCIHIPPKVKDTMYIVSNMYRVQYPERKDFVSVGSMIRDKDGRIVGTENLIVS